MTLAEFIHKIQALRNEGKLPDDVYFKAIDLVYSKEEDEARIGQEFDYANRLSRITFKDGSFIEPPCNAFHWD